MLLWHGPPHHNIQMFNGSDLSEKKINNETRGRINPIDNLQKRRRQAPQLQFLYIIHSTFYSQAIEEWNEKLSQFVSNPSNQDTICQQGKGSDWLKAVLYNLDMYWDGTHSLYQTVMNLLHIENIGSGCTVQL